MNLPYLRKTMRKALAHGIHRRRGLSWYLQQADIPETALASEYLHSPLASRQDDFILIRILGNDLYPRHRRGQTYANLKFILENEPPLTSCSTFWILNRIAAPEEASRIQTLLKQHQQPCEVIPFLPEEYAKIDLDWSCLPDPGFFESPAYRRLGKKQQVDALTATYRKKNNYVMNNNGARNHALAIGRPRAKWVLPFDGNCFFTASAWEEVRGAITAKPHMKHFVVPMVRTSDNQTLLIKGQPASSALQEPQLVFRCDTTTGFNESFCYGRRPKVEMFWTLGIPGPWDAWEDDPWDPPRRGLSEEALAFAIAGWVARISSGMPLQEKNSWFSGAYRAMRRQEAILETLRFLDQQSGTAS